MEIQLKIINKRQVERALIRAPGIMNLALKSGLKKAALLIERESKKATPVDTGRLRASIFTTLSSMQATIQPKTNYAIYVHEGTRYMKKRPFMKQGVERAEKEINKQLRSEIKKGLNKIKS